MKKAVIVNDTSFEAHHGCELVVNNIRNLLLKNDIEVINTNPVWKNWEENNKFLKDLKNSDLVLVNGEGTIHHSQIRAKQLVKIAKYSKQLNKKVVLINSTIQDNDNDIIENLKYFDLIFVRESLSKKELEKYGIKSEVVADMTFYNQFNKSFKRDKIGVTDSVFVDVTQKLFNLYLSDIEKYEYLPILTYPKFDNSFKDFLRKIKFYYFNQNKRFFKFYTNNYDEYITKIAQKEFLITARYHSLCFAIKTKTPFVAIKSNSFKIEGLLQDLELNDKITDIENINIIRFSKEEIKKMDNYIKNAKIKIENMFKQIKGLL